MKQQKSKNSKAVEKASAPQKTKKTESTPLKYCKDQDGKVVVHVDSHESDNGLTFAEIAKKKFKEIVGVGDFELAESIINRSVRGLEVAHPDQKENITLQTLNNLKPKDVIEARLITQETLLYSEMMKALWFVSTAENAWEAELRLNLSTKLTRLHNETVETLSRYRRGGNQTVTVQHVIVDNRAVVNNYGVGGVNEKRGETSCSSNYVGQDQSKLAIDHVASQQWPTGNAACMVAKVPDQELKKVDRK